MVLQTIATTSESVSEDFTRVLFELLMPYHCGKVSSHLMCRLLHVLHPFRDLVWLLRDEPLADEDMPRDLSVKPLVAALRQLEA